VSAPTAGSKAAAARALRSSTSRRELDPNGAAVGRVGLSCDEAEVVQAVDRPACRGGARPDPRSQVVQAQRAAVCDLDQRDPLGRRHRRPLVGAGGHAGEHPQQLPELLEDHRRIGCGAHLPLIVAYRNNFILMVVFPR
jgi:hypothetical protein